jgi:hypothetical protein
MDWSSIISRIILCPALLHSCAAILEAPRMHLPLAYSIVVWDFLPFDEQMALGKKISQEKI